MSITHRDFDCSPAAVFAILTDGWLYGLWVVGASRIRDVDAGWPAVRTEIQHSVGAWPLLLDDTTRCLDVVSGSSIRLQARAWPAGEAVVQIDVEPTAVGCRVTITEDAVSGPGKMLPRPLRNVLLHWRNTESLNRLNYLAQKRRPHH